MTQEELLEIIRAQDARITSLEESLLNLRKWSDVNDRWIQEIVDALTESVDKNFDKINNNIYDIQNNARRIEELIAHCPYHKECVE